MGTNITLFVVFLTLASVTSQTFQYSRGWTNGKRDGHKRSEDVANSLERILSPCQMTKLKYLLEGKTINERLLSPCDYTDEDMETPSKRYKSEHNQEPMFDAFQ